MGSERRGGSGDTRSEAEGQQASGSEAGERGAGEVVGDPSRYFPVAQALVERFGAKASVVLVVGGLYGNGCAPAIAFDPVDSPEARRENLRRIRAVVAGLRVVVDNLEKDVHNSGRVPLEPLS